MTPPAIPPLLKALRDPETLKDLSPADWASLIRQARHANLLGRIADSVFARGLAPAIPAPACAHLQAELTLVAAQRASVRREIAFIEKALADLETPIILLKGAAYLQAGLPAAAGRTFSDIDILVPPERLCEVESALLLAGWQTTHLDPYDQRYYREWMHELPPLQHIRRHSVLDVHHTILPLTARLKPDAKLLRQDAQALPEHARLQILSPPDMVLHSMTHLFHNEEFSHGLRDLSDLDCLLRHFSAGPDFWEALLRRARRLTLTRPLYYGLRYTHALLGTPVPAETLAEIAALAAPPTWLSGIMDALWFGVLCPRHPQATRRWMPSPAFLLYLRSHWFKMPWRRLLPHLAHKALRQPTKQPQKKPEA